MDTVFQLWFYDRLQPILKNKVLKDTNTCVSAFWTAATLHFCSKSKEAAEWLGDAGLGIRNCCLWICIK